MNQELGALFDQDQTDRRGKFPADLVERLVRADRAGRPRQRPGGELAVRLACPPRSGLAG